MLAIASILAFDAVDKIAYDVAIAAATTLRRHEI